MMTFFVSRFEKCSHTQTHTQYSMWNLQRIYVCRSIRAHSHPAQNNNVQQKNLLGRLTKGVYSPLATPQGCHRTEEWLLCFCRHHNHGLHCHLDADNEQHTSNSSTNFKGWKGLHHSKSSCRRNDRCQDECECIDFYVAFLLICF